MTPAIKFDNVSIVFGDRPDMALPLMDQGLDRNAIQEQTDQVMGVHDCTFDVEKGEIFVLMGLSGSGKSTPFARSQRSEPGGAWCGPCG